MTRFYFVSQDSRVYALNATTGDAIWTYTNDGIYQSSPAVANGVLYIGSHSGSVYAVGELSTSPQASPVVFEIIGIGFAAFIVTVLSVVIIVWKKSQDNGTNTAFSFR
jgi:hypothetical protein